jgi:competence protein ComEC
MNKKIIAGLSGFVLGLIFFILNPSVFFLLTFLATSLIIFAYTIFFEKEEVKSFGIFISIFLFFIVVAGLRVFIFNHNISRQLESLENKKVTLVGQAFRESQEDGLNQKVFLKIFESDDGFSKKQVSGKVLLFSGLYPKINYGDKVSVYGQLRKPKNINTDDITFDYVNFLKKDGITHTISFAKVSVLEKDEGSFLKRNLYKIKNIFSTKLSSVINEPESSIAKGIVFGEESISKKVEDIFRISGLSHILVLSGYNITIVSESIFKILLPITNSAPFFSIISIFFFILLSSVTSSSVRAGIMAVVVILAKRFGKTYSPLRTILLAFFVMVLWNPYILLYDPSFHLSFLATIAIIYLSPKVYDKLTFIPEKFLFREILSTTISAQIFVMPYIIFLTGKISLYSLMTNILVLPLIPLSMFLIFFLTIIAVFSKTVGLLFGFPVKLLLSYFVFIADFFSKLPHSQIKITNISVWLLLSIYSVFVYILFKLWRK